jgi:outer membrane protein assembly factor BamD (BamD/ComL family)
MSQRLRIFVVLAFAIPLLTPVTLAQKPPAPPPSPSPLPPTPSHPAGSSTPNLGSSQPSSDLVMFLQGRVRTSDSTPVPHDVLVERICSNKVRQQVYTSPNGEFSMQLGARSDTFLDASAEPAVQTGGTTDGSGTGIPRSDLRNCELRASGPGFHSSVINLIDLDAFGRNINVGDILVQRSAKIKGATLSALPYQATKDAQKAYERGLDADRKANLAGARKYFETAVNIYPRYTIAWFQLGNVLQKQNQKEPARAAFTRATAIDDRFLPPYLALSSMAYVEGNWPALLALTNHILDLDPLNRAAVTAFIVDLDPVNCADAYFYNAAANFELNKLEAAEKSALKAEHIALPAHFPQVHLLLAEIFARKNDNATAIVEMQTYLEMAPQAPNADQVRARLAKLRKLNGSANAAEKPM